LAKKVDLEIFWPKTLYNGTAIQNMWFPETPTNRSFLLAVNLSFTCHTINLEAPNLVGKMPRWNSTKNNILWSKGRHGQGHV